jgi:hypothetical protein
MCRLSRIECGHTPSAHVVKITILIVIAYRIKLDELKGIGSGSLPHANRAHQACEKFRALF